MKSIHCLVCRKSMPNLKYLSKHYINSHSKAQFVNLLLKYAILDCIPNPFGLRKHRRNDRRSKTERKTKTIHMTGNLRIVYGPKQILIEDGAENMEVLFDGVTSVTKDKLTSQATNNNETSQVSIPANIDNELTNSPLASSESSSATNPRKRIKRKKFSKKRNLRIAMAELNNQQSLDDEDGQFYMCCCRKKKDSSIKFISDTKLFASDTESCSDTGKHSFMPIIESKIFCEDCGSGYKTKSELKNHMEIHKTFCNQCGKFFFNEIMLKEHLSLHILKLYMCHVCKAEFPSKELLCSHFEHHMENKILEDVLDMEEDYGITRYSHRNRFNYNDSISSIICFLKDSFGYSYMKIICDICGLEVFVYDYERHLQNVHFHVMNIF